MTKATLLLALTLLMVTSCSGLNLETIGVDPTDNAVVVIQGTVDVPYTDSTGTYCRVELPAEVPVSAEQMAELLTHCRN